METILEMILEIIVLVLFLYPGALVRWLFSGCRKPFSDFLKKDAYLTGTIGLLFFVLVIVLISKFLL